MKKLMFAVAALAAGVACAEITSANIVGYNNVDLLTGGGCKGVGHTFFTIGKKAGDMKLSDLKPTGYAAGDDTGVTCQFLNEFGQTIGGKIYMWFDLPGEGVEGEDWAYGWYDTVTMESANDLPLIPGDGVWLANAYAGVTIQGAGQVPDAPVDVNLLTGGGCKLVINPMPTSCKLLDVVISGYAAGDDTGVTCQFLNEFGQTIGGKIYMWFDLPGEGVEGEDWAYGWYDTVTMESANAKDVEAGNGLWMASSYAGCKATFKSPIQK